MLGIGMDAPTIVAIVTAAIAGVSFIGTGIGIIFSLGGKVSDLTGRAKDLGEDLKEVKTELKALGKVIETQGRHDERITAIHLQVVGQGKRLDESVRRMNTFLDTRAMVVPVEDE